MCTRTSAPSAGPLDIGVMRRRHVVDVLRRPRAPTHQQVGQHRDALSGAYDVPDLVDRSYRSSPVRVPVGGKSFPNCLDNWVGVAGIDDPIPFAPREC